MTSSVAPAIARSRFVAGTRAHATAKVPADRPIDGVNQGTFLAGTHAWVIGPYLKVVGDYRKTLQKYSNPKAVNMTEFGK